MPEIEQGNPICALNDKIAVNAASKIIDLGYPHSDHTLLVVPAGALAGGVVQLYGSLTADNFDTTTAFATTGSLAGVSAPKQVHATGKPARYLKVVITTGITDGASDTTAVDAWVGSARS